MRHPQHGNILLPGVAMDNVIDVALVSVIQRAGDFVQQQRLRQELQVTDQRDALLFPSRQFGDRFGQRLRRKPEPGQIVGKLFSDQAFGCGCAGKTRLSYTVSPNRDGVCTQYDTCWR